MWGPATGTTMNVTTAMGPAMGTSSGTVHECHTSYGTIHGCHISHGDQLWAPAIGLSMDVTPAMGTKHRDKPWTWGSAQGLAVGTRHGDRAWGPTLGLSVGFGHGLGGGGQKHHPSVSPCVPWGCQSGCETLIEVPSQAVSIVTRSLPCHPGPRGARGSVLPELSPFPVLPTRPLQGFALLVLHSLLLSPNSLFLPAASTAALGRRLGFLPLPSSPRPSSPFGCQM